MGVQSAAIPRFVAPTWRHHLDASALPLWQCWTRLGHNFDRRATSYWILLRVVPEGWWVFLPNPVRPWQSPRSAPARDSNSIRCDRPASTRARQAALDILLRHYQAPFSVPQSTPPSTSLRQLIYLSPQLTYCPFLSLLAVPRGH